MKPIAFIPHKQRVAEHKVDYLRANSSPGTSMSHLIRNALQKEINITFQQKSFNGSMAIEKLVY